MRAHAIARVRPRGVAHSGGSRPRLAHRGGERAAAGILRQAASRCRRRDQLARAAALVGDHRRCRPPSLRARHWASPGACPARSRRSRARRGGAGRSRAPRKTTPAARRARRATARVVARARSSAMPAISSSSACGMRAPHSRERLEDRLEALARRDAPAHQEARLSRRARRRAARSATPLGITRDARAARVRRGIAILEHQRVEARVVRLGPSTRSLARSARAASSSSNA